VVPADNKWFTRLLVVATVVDALSEMNLEYPKLSEEKMGELRAVRKELKKE